MYFSKPTSSYGYYRGLPPYWGEGSGMGQNPVSGTNVFSQGVGSMPADTGTWTPTILYMFVLILVEMFVFAIIARHL